NSRSRAVQGVAPLGADVSESPAAAPTLSREGGNLVVETPELHVEIDERGLLTSLRAGRDGREAIAPGAGGALLQLHRDAPNAWDSWDIDEFYRHVHRDLEAESAPEVTTDDDGTVRVAVAYRTRPEGFPER